MCCGPPVLAVLRAIVYSSCSVCVLKSLFILTSFGQVSVPRLLEVSCSVALAAVTLQN